MLKQTDFNQQELARFRDVQRLAYDCAEAVAGELEEGMTEKQAAALMRAWMADHGVDTWFHKPFAWFGDRTAFSGFWNDFQFFPSNRRLEAGMPVILDLAPMVDGYVADIGYSTSLGENPLAQQMRRDLLEYRTLILDKVKARCSFREIYQAVDDQIIRQGYENIHRIYPQRVLAHRVAKIEESAISRRTLFGFGLDQFAWIVPHGLRARFNPQRADSPLWNDRAESDHAPLTGVWAVEPHLGFRGTGQKWEEILVITEDDAWWLDDEVPHLREAKAKGWLKPAAAKKKAARKKRASGKRKVEAA